MSSNENFIYIPIKSERSDNKIDANLQAEEELTSADGDAQSPERIENKMQINFPQHKRKRSHPQAE